MNERKKHKAPMWFNFLGGTCLVLLAAMAMLIVVLLLMNAIQALWSAL
jgi:hypothetical protein